MNATTNKLIDITHMTDAELDELLKAATAERERRDEADDEAYLDAAEETLFGKPGEKPQLCEACGVKSIWRETGRGWPECGNCGMI